MRAVWRCLHPFKTAIEPKSGHITLVQGDAARAMKAMDPSTTTQAVPNALTSSSSWTATSANPWRNWYGDIGGTIKLEGHADHGAHALHAGQVYFKPHPSPSWNRACASDQGQATQK